MKLHPPLETQHYSRIIYVLTDGPKMPAQIATLLEKSHATIDEQLKRLKSNKLVNIVTKKKEDVGKKNEKYKIYLMWESLCSKFLDYVDERAGLELTKFNKINLIKNRYLLYLIKKTLQDHIESKTISNDYRTINDLFEKIVMQLINTTPHNDIDIKKLSKNDSKLKEFINFTTKVEDNIIADLKDTAEKFIYDIKRKKVPSYKDFQKK